MLVGGGQAPNRAVTDEQGSHELERIKACKEWGVSLTPDMMHHGQVDAAGAKARSAA